MDYTLSFNWPMVVLVLSVSAWFLAGAYRAYKMGRNIYIYKQNTKANTLSFSAAVAKAPSDAAFVAAVQKSAKKNAK